MKLKLKVKSNYKSGDLYFESDNRSVTVHYSIGDNHSMKSLEIGDTLDITFNIGKKDIPIKGIYPEVMEVAPPIAQCIWVLSSDLIYSNISHILAGQPEEPKDAKSSIASVEQKMSGEAPEGVSILFEQN